MYGVKFRFQKSYKNVFRVGEVIAGQGETIYSTIQSAIDAAVAAGFTDNTNPALIEVYPKSSGPYVENLTFNAGVNLVGVGNVRVTVQGNHVWLPSVGGQPGNRLFLQNLNFDGVAGAETFIFGGSVNARLFFIGCTVNRVSLDDGLRCFVMQNGNSSSRVTFKDTSVYHFANAGGGYCADFVRGRYFLIGDSEIYAEGPSGNIALRMNNNAALNVDAKGFPGAASAAIFSESGAHAIELNNASNIIDMEGGRIGTVTGGALFRFNAGANVTVNNSYLSCSGPDLAIGPATGQLNFNNVRVESINAPASSYGGEYGANATPNNVSVVELNTGMRLTAKDGVLTGYVGYRFGFPSIQAAINQLSALAGGGYYRVVLALNQTFSENIVLTDGAIIEGEGNSNAVENENYIPSKIEGNVSYTAGGGAGVYLKNLLIEAVNGSRAFDYSSGGVFGAMVFENCKILKSNADAVEETMFFDGSLALGNISFINTYVSRTEKDVGSACRIDNMNLTAINTVLYVEGVAAAIASNNKALRAVNSNVNMSNSFFSGLTDRAVIAESTSMELSFCEFEINIARGEIFRFEGAGSFVRLYRNIVSGGGALPGAVVARDGSQASGSFSFSGNVYSPGDGINVNGVNFINGVDFTVGGTTAATVTNIAAAINSSVNPLIQDVVYAIANGTTLEIYSWNYSAASNAITISVVATAPATASGANLSGGANGGGGFFFYDAVFEGVTKVQNTLTVVQYPTVLTAI